MKQLVFEWTHIAAVSDVLVSPEDRACVPPGETRPDHQLQTAVLLPGINLLLGSGSSLFFVGYRQRPKLYVCHMVSCHAPLGDEQRNKHQGRFFHPSVNIFFCYTPHLQSIQTLKRHLSNKQIRRKFILIEISASATGDLEICSKLS